MTDTDTAGADDWTMQQSALLDAVRDVALCAEAPGATYAARQLVRLLALALGLPAPAEPVEREGGLAGVLFGNPVKPKPDQQPAEREDNLSAAAIDAYGAGKPIRVARPIRDQPQA